MAGPITLPFVTTYNDKGAKDADRSLKGLMKTQVAGVVSMALLTQQVGKAFKAYAEEETAQKQLALAVRNSTNANDSQIASMESVIEKMQFQKAVSDDVLRPSLQTLVRATKDLSQAQGLLNLALDISAGTGKDLETVSLALAKAQNGNVGALTRLGVSLDADSVKSKDFNAIQHQLAISFKGAADAAANTAEGGMKKMSIALDTLYETIGERLSPGITDFMTVLTGLLENTNKSTKGNDGLIHSLHMFTDRINELVNPIQWLSGWISKTADAQRNLGKQTSFTTAEFRLMDEVMTNKYNVAVEESAAKLKELAKKQKEAAAAAKAHADTLRDRVQVAFERITDQVKLAQAAFDGFKDSLSDQLRGFVSLSDAVKTQDDAESDLRDSLKERMDAYAELKKIDPVEDAKAYAAALETVAAAEAKVGSATATRAASDYSKAFSKQIEDAKVFGANLQRLVNSGLSQDGLSQLINLGPVAGRQVTQDIIDNTNGMNLGQFVSSLADLRSAGESLGGTGANAFFGAALSGAQGAQGQVNQYQITVNAGLVSNPAQVGREIIEAIKQAERVSGQVFVSV